MVIAEKLWPSRASCALLRAQVGQQHQLFGGVLDEVVRGYKAIRADVVEA